MAPSKGVSGNKMANSSPPTRATRSLPLIDSFDCGCDHSQHVVPHQMAVGIVDLLKVIDVGNDQAKGRTIGSGFADYILQRFSQIHGDC
jgi:hypothetical protein